MKFTKMTSFLFHLCMATLQLGSDRSGQKSHRRHYPIELNILHTQSCNIHNQKGQHLHGSQGQCDMQFYRTPCD